MTAMYRQSMSLTHQQWCHTTTTKHRSTQNKLLSQQPLDW